MELMRTCVFQPLRDGRRFILRTYYTGKTDQMGKAVVAYRFTEAAKGSRHEEIIFSGDDFHVGSFTVIDSDKAICALMGFLTLRPGDTDKEYFSHYTERQHVWMQDYACEVIACDVATYEDALGQGHVRTVRKRRPAERPWRNAFGAVEYPEYVRRMS